MATTVTNDPSEIVRVVRAIYLSFGDEFRKERQMINNAAKKAARPGASYVKQMMLTEGVKESNANGLGFSKLKTIARLVTPYAKKRHPNKQLDAYGVRYRMRKGVSITVSKPKSGGKMVRWNAQGYAKLLAEGSYKTGQRVTKAGKNRGAMPAFGNWFQIAEQKFDSIHKKAWRKQIIVSAKKAGYRAAKRRQKAR